MRAEAVLRGGTGRAIAGSRFLAVAHSLVPVLAGTLRMPVRRFARLHGAGSRVVGRWSTSGSGSAASAALRHAAHLVGPTVTGVAVAAVVVVLVVRAVRKRRAESAARRVAAPGNGVSSR